MVYKLYLGLLYFNKSGGKKDVYYFEKRNEKVR